MDYETVKQMELRAAELLCSVYISKFVKFEVLTAVFLTILFFWDVTLRLWVRSPQHFEGM
jgi:hypothetical protein